MENQDFLSYNAEHIKTLDWIEHIRTRPGMYVGKLGDGSSYDDGIYVLFKEVMDNCIDEFMMGFGTKIDISVIDKQITIRDYGRGIPLTKVVDVSSKMNTGAKYDNKVFKKAIGLNGVGIKAVNALSSSFIIKSIRDFQVKEVQYEKGKIKKEFNLKKTKEENGTEISFIPDEFLFKDFNIELEFIKNMIHNYTYLNTGLRIYLNNEEFYSKDGLLDLLTHKIHDDILYPIVHIIEKDMEIAFTHTSKNKEEYFTYVNGQNTTQGGNHLIAFKSEFFKVIKDYYKKNYEQYDIKQGLIVAMSIKISDPMFESQTKTKLGSILMEPNGDSIKNFIQNFLSTKLIAYLYDNKEISEKLLEKLTINERERIDINEIRKISSKNSKNFKVYNSKLRDCKIHLTSKDVKAGKSTLFITEGDSASGSITKVRNVATQAVFSLKGKPLNIYGKSKKIIYENEEFNSIISALNVSEESIEKLKYNNIVIATDADVDGMHIRLLMITFFIKYFPDIVNNKHLYILETPLFRVRNKTKSFYCYTEKEKEQAIKKLKNSVEITRFKGLGEISPDEFKNFIGDDIRLTPVIIDNEEEIEELLDFYMGNNTKKRQEFIMNNLKTNLI